MSTISETAAPDSFDDSYVPSAAANDRSGQKLKRLLLDLAGRWYWIVLGLIIGLLAAGYYLSKAPKEYTATSTLLIKTQTSTVMARDQVEDIDPRSAEYMNTAVARIIRFDLLELVASQPDVREIPGLIPPAVDWRPQWWQDRNPSPGAGNAGEVPPPAALAGQIGGWLNVSIRRYTRLLDISVTHQVPEVSKALADAIARQYLHELAGSVTKGRIGTIEVLTQESEAARIKLQEARSAMATYSRALEVNQALDQQEAAVAEMRRVYLPAHPKMQAALSALEELEERFLKEFEVARNAAADQKYWETVREGLPDRAADSDAHLRTARQQLVARIGVLESEIASNTTVFNSMLTRIEEASVNQVSEESSVEVSSLARVPGWPSKPDPDDIYTKGGMGGFAAGLAIAFLLTRLDNKFHTVAQVAAESEGTVLAAIAHIHPAHLRAAEKAYAKKHPDADHQEFEEWDPLLVFRPGVSGTSYAEMYRVLRASVSLLGDEKRRKVTLFTSALPGEGKTATSCNFALAAAGQKRRTLLIDLDLRQPAVHDTFGLPRSTGKGGITECLAGMASVSEVLVTGLPEPSLHLILGGMRAPNPGELLDTGRLRMLLDWATSNYDVVVLDTAPLLAVSDTRIIAALAHNICLVVRADYTPKGAVRRVLEVLEEDGTHLSGIVFNGFREKRHLIGENYSYGYYRTSRYGRAYQYGYGSYGSYGSDDDASERRHNRRNRRRRKVKS